MDRLKNGTMNWLCLPDIACVGHMDHRLDPGLPLLVSRYYFNHQHRTYEVLIGPERPYFALNRSFLFDIAKVEHINPYFAPNRKFLPDISWVSHIDPYNVLNKYQVCP